MKREENKFYVTPMEIAGVFGIMGTIYAAVPWNDINTFDKVVAFVSIALLGVVGVASVEMLGETAQDILKWYRARKIRSEQA